jgi:hypothetical protein
MPAAKLPVGTLDRKNPEWLLYHDMWEKLDLMHEGGVRLKNAADAFLIKRPKELFDVYQERIRRFTYKNVLGNVTGWYVTKMFQRNPTIDTKNADAFYSGFLANSDNAGTSYIDFFRGVLLSMLLYRSAYVLIDKPRADVPPESRADEQAAGLDRPYLCGYMPVQVINWAADSYGNLNWVVIKTVTQDQETWDGQPSTLHSWYIFDRQNYYEYQVRGELKQEQDGTYKLYDANGQPLGQEPVEATLAGSGQHALANFNRVPVRKIELPATLWLSNRAYLELIDHLNTENTLMWALFMANLAMPLIIGQQDLKTMTLSEAGFLHLTDKDAKFLWTEPEGKSFAISQTRLDTLRQEVYRSFYLQAQGRDSSASAAGSSGYSKELDMAPAADVANGLGDYLRIGMQRVLIDVRDARGDTTSDPDVQGFRFEARPALQDIQTSQAVIDLGVTDKSKTLEIELDKRVALSLLDDANDATKDKVVKEIEAAPSRAEAKDQEQQAQQQMFQNQFQRATAKGVLNSEESAAA